MKRQLLAAVAAAFAGSVPLAGAAPSASELVGLWAAAQDLGPEVRGPLALRRIDGALKADIAGFLIPVTRDGPQVRFELPGVRGAFRGRISGDGKEVRGFWSQPRSATNVNGYASAVALRGTDGDWRGEVKPLDLRFSVYLPVTQSAEGKLLTHFRNPERNIGVFTPVKSIELDGERVRLVGSRRGKTELETFYEGRWVEGRMEIGISSGEGVYTFAKVDSATSAFYPRGHPGEKYRYAPPLRLDDGWPVATLEDVGISRPAIERFIQHVIDVPMDSVGASQVHSILIARHGKLVLEEYFHGHHRDQPHETRSASKSILGTLLGAAMQAGIPIRESTPVYETMLGKLPADLEPRKKDMRLEHLITMTGGHFCDDSNPDAPGNEDAIQDNNPEKDWLRIFLAVPMDRTPGEKFTYCSMETYLGGMVLEKVAKEPLPELFDRLIARPLRMGPYHAFLAPTGDAYVGGGWKFLPRDFLKLAQLMMNGGTWEGRRILSREWAVSATTAHKKVNKDQDYGYTWWTAEYPYADRKVHAFFAAGNGGNVFIAVPELDLAVGFTGGNYADAALFIPQRRYVPEQILPAVQSP